MRGIGERIKYVIEYISQIASQRRRRRGFAGLASTSAPHEAGTVVVGVIDTGVNRGFQRGGVG